MQNSSNITLWQESMSALKDEKFFEIMRLYLGELKTPYNKQRLIEQLASFIRNEANRKGLITLVDDFDAKVLSAISIIPNATKELLIEFFSADYSMTDMYNELSNIQERLLVYVQEDKYSSKQYFRINPLLEEELKPFINIKNILRTEPVAFYSTEDIFSLNSDFIGALISFLKIRGCSFKIDGTLKKGDANRLEEIFKDKVDRAQFLLQALMNLNLLREGEKALIVDEERFNLFAELPLKQQMALICAGSCSRFSREGLKKEAQLFLDVMSSIPESGYPVSTIVKLAFLAGNNSSSGRAGSAKSRFSQILESARQEKSILAENSGPVIERMIDSAIAFGFLQKLGKTENDVEIFSANPIFKERGNPGASIDGSNTPKVLNIDSTYTVSLLPGLSLKQFLPLTSFISIKTWGIVSEFEISRQSITSAFDKGWTPETIFAEMKKYSGYDFPQNLLISVEDWYNSYLSARIYVGYVLKVTENNISFVENNPRIKKYIKEKLAEGVYLLNVPVNEDISEFISESGLEFMGKIKNPETPHERISFPLLNEGTPVCVDENADYTTVNFSKANELLSGLKDELQNMEVDENIKESLAYRIKNRLILSPEQLKTTSVRSEILEADGLDYSGKVFLLEAAIKNGDKVELTLPSYNKQDSFFTIVVNPLGITKQIGDAIIRFEVLPDKEIQNFIVSRITHVRRIRF